MSCQECLWTGGSNSFLIGGSSDGGDDTLDFLDENPVMQGGKKRINKKKSIKKKKKSIKKKRKSCGPGRRRSPKTHRCIKKKSPTKKKSTTKKKRKSCGVGRRRSPKTHRCINIKKKKTVLGPFKHERGVLALVNCQLD